VSGDDSQPSLQLRTQAFLQDFFARGQRLVRDLIDENEDLRTRLATNADAIKDPELVARLTRQVERLEAEVAHMHKRGAPLELPSTSYRRRLEVLEFEHYQLAAMYVAGRQLQSAVTIGEVVRTVTEIVLNFVGVGRFCLYGLDEPRATWFPLQTVGWKDAERPPEIPRAEVVVHSGVPPAKLPPPRDGGLLDLPLRSGERLVALLRLEAFLPQKSAFSESDFALLEIIAECAGIMLESAWIRAHCGELPLARTGLEELLGHE